MPAPKREGKLSKADMKLRDQAMLMRRLQGDSIKQMQERFQCSDRTVLRALSRAKKAQYIQTGQGLILTELIPSAIGAVKAAIEMGELELAASTALKVLEGVGVIGKQAVLAGADEGEVVETFEAFRRQIIKRVDNSEDIIDAEVKENGQTITHHRAEQPSVAGSGEAGQRGVSGNLPLPARTDAGDGPLGGDRGSSDAEEG